MGLRKGQKHAGSIKKGEVRNAGGRPKLNREWKAWLLRLFDKPSMRKHIVEQIKSDNRVMMWAGEQAHGRAAQALIHSGNVEGLHIVNPEATVTELRRYADEIEESQKFCEGKESILDESLLQ
jgi:hypothetical protein